MTIRSRIRLCDYGNVFLQEMNQYRKYEIMVFAGTGMSQPRVTANLFGCRYP